MSDWQPIETAPKDGTNVLLAWPYISRCAIMGYYHPECRQWLEAGAGWTGYSSHYPPTHWMPLPALPAPTQEATNGQSTD